VVCSPSGDSRAATGSAFDLTASRASEVGLVVSADVRLGGTAGGSASGSTGILEECRW